jgi:DNA-binding MarR family transcriptional regulator
MLTEKGRELIAQAGPSVAEAEAGLFEGLSEPDRQQLLALLTGVRRNCPNS